MNQREFYYSHQMSNLNYVNCSFPYFASKENQTIYVMVPIANPIMYSHLRGNYSKNDDYFTEEEILPDFRCKICSVTMFNYSEFRIHLQEHEKSSGELLKNSFHSRVDRVQGLDNKNCRVKSNISQNVKNSAIFNNSEHDYHLDTPIECKNLTSKDKVVLSEISPTLLQEEHKTSLFSNKPVVSFDNSIFPSNNLRVFVDSKSDDSLEMQNKESDSKFKNPNFLNFPLNQTLNEGVCHALASKLSKHTNANFPFIGDHLKIRSTLDNENKNSPFTNELHLESETSREKQGIVEGKNTIPVSKSSTTNPVLTVTYTGLKEIITKNDKKRNTKESNLDRIPPADQIVNQKIDKLNASFSKSQPLGDEYETSRKENCQNEGVGHNENSPSKLYPLQSMEVSDRIITILQLPTIPTNGKEKSTVKVKTSKAHKEPNLDGIFSRTLAEKKVHQTMDKLNASLSTSQPLGDINNSAVSNCSRDKGTGSNECNISKTNSLKSVDASVSILEPLINTKGKVFRCFYCRKTFKYRIQMRKHIAKHKETKFIYCILCNSSFSCISSLRKHLLMFHYHAKDRRHCPYCNYRCFQNSDLEKHIARKHTRDFKYKCSYCIKGFATPKELNNHLKRKH